MSTIKKASLFGSRYPSPAYCGQCDQVLDGWFEVIVGVGELSQRRWKCPKCGMKVPDELMQSKNPHDSRWPTLTPGAFYAVDAERHLIIDQPFPTQHEAQIAWRGLKIVKAEIIKNNYSGLFTLVSPAQYEAAIGQQIATWLDDKANTNKKEKPDMTAIVVHDESNAALNVDERTEFQQLEAVIQTGLQTFFEVGNALMEIRDRRLYRETHKTFDDYCNQRWQIGRAQAYRLIGAAQVVEDLSPMGDIPQNERQARPLSQLAPERRAEVWQRAVATAPDGKVTAEHVQQVVDEALGKAGRFENKKFYPVNDRDKEIYRQPRDTSPGWNEDRGILYGCAFFLGEKLNQEKKYDAYAFVDVPEYTPAVEISAVLPPPKESWVEYPVSEKEKTIFCDPKTGYRSRPGYYTDCEWIRYAELVQRWPSFLYRYGDFHVAPAIEPPTAWLSGATFQPGMQAKCAECNYAPNGGVYPYAQWAVDGEKLWVCPRGHRKADPLMNIYKQEAMPGTQPLDDEDDEPEDDELEDDDPLTGDMQDVLDCVNNFADLLGYIRDNRTLVESALQPDVLASYNDLGGMEITDEMVADLKKLIECFGTPSTGEEA